MDARKDGRTKNDSGILLLETLIAFVIAAMALAVVYRAVFDGAAASLIARRNAEAILRAQSRLAALEVLAPVSRYVQSGDDGGGFRYREAATPLPRLNNAPLRAMRLSVTVSWGAPSEFEVHSARTAQGRQVTLTTEIAVPAAEQS